MSKGKETCRQLKEIRRQIAAANDISFVTEECSYKGECKGTCPKCEAEVRYLESQLRQRQIFGKAVMVAGLSLGVITATANTSSATPVTDNKKVENPDQPQGKYKITGHITYHLDNEIIMGALVYFEKDGYYDKKRYAISDQNGDFTISTDELPQKLIVSFIGCKDYKVLVTPENYTQPFNICLEEDDDNTTIGEVVYVKKKHWLPKFLRKKR